MKANAPKRKIFDAVDMLTEEAPTLDTAEATDGIQMLPVEKIKPFHEHPFRLYDGDRLDDMVESIREHDVRWTDRIQSQSGDWSGNVFDFFSRVSAKLVLDLKKPFQLVDMARVDETPLHDAVREALVNCLVNTDFFEPRGVVIEKYPDRIEFRNPGTSIVGKKQMLRGGESEPRNGILMKMFNLIGYGERAGSGVPDIYAVWNEAGYVDPTVEEQFGSGQPNRTIVTLPLVTKKGDFFEKSQAKSHDKGQASKASMMEARKEKVLQMIKNGEFSTVPAIASELGLTDRQVRTAIDQLKKAEKVCFEGAGRNGHWIAKEK